MCITGGGRGPVRSLARNLRARYNESSLFQALRATARLTFAIIPYVVGFRSARASGEALLRALGTALRRALEGSHRQSFVDNAVFRAPAELAVFSQERHLGFYSRKTVHRRKPAPIQAGRIYHGQWGASIEVLIVALQKGEVCGYHAPHAKYPLKNFPK